MSNQTEMELLSSYVQLAIELEREGLVFYQEHLAKALDPVLDKAFEIVQEERRVHLGWLEDLQERITADTLSELPIPEAPPIHQQAARREQIEMGSQVRETQMGDRSLLLHALISQAAQLESNTIRFYNSIALQGNQEEVGQFFSSLCLWAKGRHALFEEFSPSSPGRT